MLRRIIAWSVLLSPLALAAAVPAAAPAGAAIGSPSGPSAVTARTAAVAAAQPVLRLGSRGGAVKTLQQRLAALHYFDVSAADGVFGQNTYHAVIAFQKVQGLGRDGIVGSATWAKLARPYVPAPRYRLATASLEVNLAKQVLYYVRNGAIQRIIDASTGSGKWYYSQGRWAKAVTPTGPLQDLLPLQRLAVRATRLAVPPGLLLRWLRRARHDVRACLPGEPRLRPDDRPHDGPHVVLAPNRHAGGHLPLVTARSGSRPRRSRRPPATRARRRGQASQGAAHRRPGRGRTRIRCPW
jgi:hypothetical protein